MSERTESAHQGELGQHTHEHERRDPRSGNLLNGSNGVAGASRFLIFLSIAGVGLSAVAMLVYALIVVIKTIYHTFAAAVFSVDGARHLAVEFIEMTDLFLLGMVLYVVAIGMYQLFINDDITIPAWMRVTNLDELKAHLVSVVVVLIAVSFLAEAVAWDGSTSIIYIGGAASAVILALGLYNLMHHFAERDKH